MRNLAVLARRAMQNPRGAIAYATPFVIAPFARSETLHRLRLGLTSRRDMFARAYQAASWGSEESGSGDCAHRNSPGVLIGIPHL
jgi:hypothetical protein